MTSPLQRHRLTEDRLQSLASHVETQLPEGMCFALVCFTAGDEGGYSSYVSNGYRPDMIRALREAADRMQARTDSGPRADIEELHFRKNRHARRAAARTSKAKAQRRRPARDGSGREQEPE